MTDSTSVKEVPPFLPLKTAEVLVQSLVLAPERHIPVLVLLVQGHIVPPHLCLPGGKVEIQLH